MTLHVECQGAARVPVAKGLVQQLQVAFPDEATLAVERAVAGGLSRALGDEGVELREVMCNRDYSRLCPEGVRLLTCIPRVVAWAAFFCITIFEDGPMPATAIPVWRQATFRVRHVASMRPRCVAAAEIAKANARQSLS
jgi:hypothetical protein